VIAEDAGSPPLSASLVVDVVVTDVNDNQPVFESAVYETDITENVDPATYGSVLVTVRASDNDDGTNGQVRYRLSTRSQAQFGHLFNVDETTGEVRLVQAVDYEALPRGGVIVLEVLAHDLSGAADSVTSPVMTSVRIRVLDVNDNAPSVSVEDRNGDRDLFHVMENCANGTLLGYVTVSDADAGDAGRVHCHLRHSNGVRHHPPSL